MGQAGVGQKGTSDDDKDDDDDDDDDETTRYDQLDSARLCVTRWAPLPPKPHVPEARGPRGRCTQCRG